MRRPWLSVLLCGSVLLVGGCRVGAEPEPSQRDAVEPERFVVRVLGSTPHDPDSYTQGLLWHRGVLYESRGRYGTSGVRKIRYEDGEILADVALSPDLFGEGLARVGDRYLVQLTWRAGVAIYYDPEDLTEVGRRNYRGEGWGLAWDGEHLIMSDGSHVLTFRDPESFALVRRLPVFLRGAPRDLLNELEYVDGALFANVYETDEIVRIDPKSGVVTAVIDASQLLTPEEAAAAEVLNGIAWEPERRRFLLTGKYWPRLFEVTFESARE